MIDMGEIQKITIAGFRGINTPPLEIDFHKEKLIQSVMIYGTNGSGKSSIVDAWEWLYSGKIEHLAREGAGERAFPHKEAKDGQTWVEIEFTNKEIGKIRAEFNSSRITMPKIEGNLSKLKEIILYPCYLRYRDLTDFVYKRKAEKYEILSRQMGFGNAIDIQNQLQSGVKRIEEELNNLGRDRDSSIKEYYDVADEEPKDIPSFINTLNIVFKRQTIPYVKEITEVQKRLEKLREYVEKDEKSKKLQLWKDIQRIISQLYPMEDIHSNISKFQEKFTEFKQDEEEISKLILLELYEKGIGAIESLKIYNRCPLCDQPYEGNLIEHIKTKKDHLHLNELNKRREELEKRRKELSLSIDGIIRKFDYVSPYLEGIELEPLLIQLKENLKNLYLPLKECKNMLEKGIENIDKKFNFLTKLDTKKIKFLLDSEIKIKEEISVRVGRLEKDESRKALIDDFQQVTKLQASFLKWKRLNKKIEKLKEIMVTYEEVKNDYIEETKKSVQISFDAISYDVAAYFKILEQDSKVLDDPKIKLYSEKDKAVELEIIFGGNVISPAYKYLSESQLNSFGLSIFFASAKHFNHNFKFIILDDVINSFDTYKRPKVIDILSKYFSDYQILLFTHDSIWLDRLQRSFPQWIRKRFFGWDYNIGPRIETGKNSYEQIDEFIIQDKPTEAGWAFGRYLEWVLQELCENLEASVRYNRRNEFTLSELVQAFRARIKKKLESDHPITKMISVFESNIGFRNFCDHWKESETNYSSPEIKNIVQEWKNIESKIECNKCHKFIRYEKMDSHEHIFCPCGELTL